MTTALVEHGKLMKPYGSEGPTVRAVPNSAVRHEFTAAYPADESAAKRMAFNRALKQAREKELICSREIGRLPLAGRAERGQTEHHGEQTEHFMCSVCSVCGPN
jgi:hypothetical protein